MEGMTDGYINALEKFDQTTRSCESDFMYCNYKVQKKFKMRLITTRKKSQSRQFSLKKADERSSRKDDTKEDENYDKNSILPPSLTLIGSHFPKSLYAIFGMELAEASIRYTSAGW